MTPLEPGRVVARDLGRQFKLAPSGGRSLRAALLRREGPREAHEFWALRHVDLDIAPGETFGIVGRNGSGKSTLLKMLARIYGPSEGSCAVGGRLSSLLELGAGFHGEFNAIENVYLSGSIYGIPKSELTREMDSIIGFAELEEFAHQPIKTYSSGMFMRLGFSVAMHVHPDVLLLDEVFAVGDEKFVHKCLTRIAEYRRNGGTMLLVSHDPETIRRLCSRAILLEKGRVITHGSSDAVINIYHERLAQVRGSATREGTTTSTDDFDVTVTVHREDGELHGEFLEGEAMIVRATIRTRIEAPELRVGLGIRDPQGQEIGDRSVQNFGVRDGETWTIELQLENHPLRSGLFLIDIGILDVFRGEVLFHECGVSSFSVYGQTSDSHGPVQLNGSMSASRTV